MGKFDVSVTYALQWFETFTVEAATKEGAEKKAIDMAYNHDFIGSTPSYEDVEIDDVEEVSEDDE